MTDESYLYAYGLAAWGMLRAMAPWLLVGFALAGVLSQIIPTSLVRRVLATQSAGSVFKAVLIGIPLPLCSCGVIPVAASLRRAGASKGATAAFTASTPQTGVDSISATYSMMGWPFTLARIAADVISGLLAGIWINLTDKGIGKENDGCSEAPASCCGCDEGVASDTSDSQRTPRPVVEASGLKGRVAAAWREGFVVLPRDIGLYLIIGILLGALLTTVIPHDLVERYLPGSVVSYALVTLVSMPVYVCATGSIPVAFGLISAGFSPGAALVFLVTGPATNTATISTLLKLIGKKATFIYLTALLVGAWSVGALVDWVGIQPVAGNLEAESGTHSIGNVSAILLLVVLATAWRKSAKR